MNQEKYIGMDVHDATISAAVINAQGKLLMECVLETKAATILEFIQGRAFGVDSTGRTWQVTVGILCLASVVFTLYKFKPELKAFQWHRRHGDIITVNGITFPVYKWDAPSQNSAGLDFEIAGFDRPSDHKYFITVQGCKDESDLTSEHRVETKMLEYQKAGYRQVSRSQLVIAKQALSCVREQQFGYSLWCYGDGPIYHVFFAGDDAALDRFNQMMAAAR